MFLLTVFMVKPGHHILTSPCCHRSPISPACISLAGSLCHISVETGLSASVAATCGCQFAQHSLCALGIDRCRHWGVPSDAVVVVGRLV